MRLGCFGFSGDIGAIYRAGFDFAELDLMELSRMTDVEFSEFARRAGDSGLGFDAFSGFMPLTERIHSPGFPAGRWLEHARKMAGRTAQLGGVLWPLGAGKCRSIPEGADPAAARARLLDFFGGIARIAAPFGVRLCIEPLGPNNSNYLNTVGEAAEFALETGAANCGTMCDMRHMVALSEPFGDIAIWRESVWHAHIDYPLGIERRFPNPDDGCDYRPYLAALRGAGYPGPLTVEATSYANLEREGAACVKMLRGLIAQ